MPEARPLSILVLASEFKGAPFIEECKRQGCRIMLLVASSHAGASWPWHCIDEHWGMPDITKQPDVLYAVSYLARERHIDRVVPLDDYDVETSAGLREHMRLPGMSASAARFFRDKLAMREQARRCGLPIPEFTGFFHYGDLRAFMDRVPAPWVLKPRSLAGSDGIRLMHNAQEVWSTLAGLADQQTFHLMEQFIPGDVYHVDALTWRGEVVFSLVSKYGKPPMAALQSRGIFTTQVLPPQSDEVEALRQLNRRVLQAMGRDHGVTHTEFIRARDTGEWYFLETAARVGGGAIDKVVEAATGVVLWQEAARMELCDARSEEYALPPLREGFAGLVACPTSKQVDLAVYTGPEIVFRSKLGEFVSMVLRADSAAGVDELITRYSERLGRELLG